MLHRTRIGEQLLQNLNKNLIKIGDDDVDDLLKLQHCRWRDFQLYRVGICYIMIIIHTELRAFD